MAAFSGGVLAGTINKFSGSARRAFSGGTLVNAVVLGSSPAVYKNEGWYAAGSTWEVWVSIGVPSTFPPTAHALTFIHHDVLSQ